MVVLLSFLRSHKQIIIFGKSTMDILVVVLCSANDFFFFFYHFHGFEVNAFV